MGPVYLKYRTGLSNVPIVPWHGPATSSLIFCIRKVKCKTKELTAN